MGVVLPVPGELWKCVLRSVPLPVPALCPYALHVAPWGPGRPTLQARVEVAHELLHPPHTFPRNILTSGGRPSHAGPQLQAPVTSGFPSGAAHLCPPSSPSSGAKPGVLATPLGRSSVAAVSVAAAWSAVCTEPPRRGWGVLSCREPRHQVSEAQYGTIA